MACLKWSRFCVSFFPMLFDRQSAEPDATSEEITPTKLIAGRSMLTEASASELIKLPTTMLFTDNRSNVERFVKIIMGRYSNSFSAVSVPLILNLSTTAVSIPLTPDFSYSITSKLSDALPFYLLNDNFIPLSVNRAIIEYLKTQLCEVPDSGKTFTV